MRKTIFVAGLAAAAALAACGGDTEYSDTATVPGIDTSAGLAVPSTTDTLMTTTPVDTMLRDTLTDTTTTP